MPKLLLPGLLLFVTSQSEADATGPLPLCTNVSALLTDWPSKVFLDTFWHLREHRDSLNEDQEMVPATQITLLFTDWTDPMKAV